MRRWRWAFIAAMAIPLCFASFWRGFHSENAVTKEPVSSGEDITTASARGKSTTRETIGRRAAIFFEDKSETLGIQFSSYSGSTNERAFPTANGNGVAMLDFDQDGWLDLYFANGCRLESAGAGPPNGLFRSQMGQRFDEVGSQARADVQGFTQGLAVADYDNDGFPDLYLTRFGPNKLLQNMGDGTFLDCTDSSGSGDPRWSTSAAFFDFDEEGSLDLYVANYGQWDLNWHNTHICGPVDRMIRVYCSPKILTPEVHALFRSRGDGSFSDVAAELGIARHDGRGQGVVACDVNNDGHMDLYVANDLCPNFLFVNNGTGGFEDCTLVSCAGYNEDGNVEAGMGVDAGDVNGDGLPELYVTNFFLEHNTLYQNLGRNLFQDVSNSSGVAAASIYRVGWGTALEDLDGDGWPDIFVANGHVDDNLKEAFGRDEPYAQMPGLWRNLGRGVFEHVEGDAGPYFSAPHVGRGAAFGDLDNDGDIDIVVTHRDDRPAILSNESTVPNQPAHSWIQLKLIGTRSNRDAIGTRVELQTAAAKTTISRQIRGGKSYLSAHDLRLTIGLGDAAQVDRLSIYWPSHTVTVMESVELNRAYTIREPVDTGF